MIVSDKLGLELEMCSKWLVDNKLSLHMEYSALSGNSGKAIIFQLNVMVIQLRHSVQ